MGSIPIHGETAMETIVISMEKMGIMESGDGVHTVCDSKSNSNSNGKKMFIILSIAVVITVRANLKGAFTRNEIQPNSFILKYLPVFQFSIVSMAMG